MSTPLGTPTPTPVAGLPPAGARRPVGTPARSTGARLLTHTPVLLPAEGPADPAERSLAIPGPERHASHVRTLGPCPAGGPGLVDVVAAAELTGHGGAHVPSALKWRAVLAGSGPLTLVANAAESEPVAAKDGTLVRQRPHLVLDGLQLAAQALGAVRAVVWLHGDDVGAARTLRAAIAERPPAPGTPALEVLTGPVHYLAGEASAITRAVLTGGPALPTARRPVVPGAPRALVHNAETLARLALLARGLDPSGTRLLTVLGEGRAVVEVDSRTTLAHVLVDLGWTEAPQAVLLGGYGGQWARWGEVAHLPVDEASFRRAGLSLGAGVVVPIGAWVCGVRQAAAAARYLASMSARQCGPCVFGLPALAGTISALAEGEVGPGVQALLDDAGVVEGRGACHHPDGATRMLASAVRTFAGDLAAHAAGRPCDATEIVLPGVDR
jgi:NADH:ubiquinone oxidoreductase subunit F (NADH-binding)